MNLLPYACPSKDIHPLFKSDFQLQWILVKCLSAILLIIVKYNLFFYEYSFPQHDFFYENVLVNEHITKQNGVLNMVLYSC